MTTLWVLVKWTLLLHIAALILIVPLTTYLVNRPIEKRQLENHESKDYELYFAYGTNMSAKYLSNIRNVHAIESQPATLMDYVLTFNLLGRNFLEPGFANIVAAEGEKVEGVIHRVSQLDLNKILASEPGQYQIVDVTASVNGDNVRAKTLIHVIDSNQTFQPSRRYIRLLVKAAEEHGLPTEYIQKIKSTSSVHYPVLSEIYGSIIYLYLMYNTKTN